MIDLVLANGLIVDGTGQPGFTGAIGIDGEKIVYVGSAPPEAKHTVDVRGQVIAPGFVDIHTHYDAQVLWDPMLTISPWHGVTTAVMGSCGFGIAPTKPQGRNNILRTLERVEAMSLSALNAGLGSDWGFESFAEYLNLVESQGTAINVAVMIGHTPIRLYVMGKDAVEREATETEIEEMAELVRQGLEDGALAFATSVSTVHYGFDGFPVPSRMASKAEMLQLAQAVKQAGTGIIHYNVARNAAFDDYVAIQKASGTTVCWTALLAGQLGRGKHREVLARNRELIDQGYPIYPQVACRPIVSEFRFDSPVIFDTWKIFAPVRSAKTHDDLKAIYRDKAFREVFKRELAGHGNNDDFFSGGSGEGEMRRASLLLTEVSYMPGNDQVINRAVNDLANERGVDFVDCLLDLALESGLAARFRTPLVNFQEDEVEEILTDPITVLGLGDGGAHLSQLCDACYATHLLGHWVREKRAITLERGVQMLTSHPASVFQIKKRGKIECGYFADLVVFDPDTVGASPLLRVNDLPAGADRLISHPIGIDSVYVNGQKLPPPGEKVIERDKLSGKVLRWGG
jgi:N-acyl-D-amino-acid deacylase